MAPARLFRRRTRRSQLGARPNSKQATAFAGVRFVRQQQLRNVGTRRSSNLFPKEFSNSLKPQRKYRGIFRLRRPPPVRCLFNEVRAKKYLRPNSIEVMKQHVFHSSPGVNTPASGWRMEAFVDDWRIGFGDEVVATRPLDAAGLEPIHSKRLREFLYGMKTTTYGAAGLRLNDFESGFSFEGLGSILGRTYVDQTMTTLQSAPSWHSVPWRKVPSGVSRRS